MIPWLLIPAGVLIIIYAEKVAEMSGSIDFAETAFGPGGTYTFIKLVGLGMSVISFAYLIGGLDILLSPLKRFF